MAGDRLATDLKVRNVIAVTAMIGLGVSLAIEIVQYVYGLGRAKTYGI